MFTPEKLRMLPIFLTLGLLVGMVLSCWLILSYLPRNGWDALWELQYRIIAISLGAVALLTIAKVVLVFLGYKELAAAL